MKLPQIFKTKRIINFRKYRIEREFRLGGLTISKSSKIEKTEQLIIGYQEVECLWNVFSPS